MAAKYLPQNNAKGMASNLTSNVSNTGSLDVSSEQPKIVKGVSPSKTIKTVEVLAERKQLVSSLSQPQSDEDFIKEYGTKPRNVGFNSISEVVTPLNSAAFFLVSRFYMLRCLFGALYAVMRFFGGSWFLHRHEIPHPNQWGI